MLISYSHEFIFIHVPKAAGSSLARALRDLSHRAPDHLWNRLLAHSRLRCRRPALHRHKRFAGHVHARQLQRELPPELWRRMFKFALVRNPWDRLVSQYHFVLKNGGHHRHRRIAALGSFEAFVDFDLSRPRTLQQDFLTDGEGELLVDFVGRYETLADDFAHICRRLGVQADLPHFNRSQHDDYRQLYTRDTRDRVGQHYREDIERFGYTFEGFKPLPASA